MALGYVPPAGASESTFSDRPDVRGRAPAAEGSLPSDGREAGLVGQMGFLEWGPDTARPHIRGVPVGGGRPQPRSRERIQRLFFEDGRSDLGREIAKLLGP